MGSGVKTYFLETFKILETKTLTNLAETVTWRPKHLMLNYNRSLAVNHLGQKNYSRVYGSPPNPIFTLWPTLFYDLKKITYSAAEPARQCSVAKYRLGDENLFEIVASSRSTWKAIQIKILCNLNK